MHFRKQSYVMYNKNVALLQAYRIQYIQYIIHKNRIKEKMLYIKEFSRCKNVRANFSQCVLLTFSIKSAKYLSLKFCVSKLTETLGLVTLLGQNKSVQSAVRLRWNMQLHKVYINSSTNKQATLTQHRMLLKKVLPLYYARINCSNIRAFK